MAQMPCAIPANTTSYVYDSLDQLTRENNQAAGKTWVYTYDAWGNPLTTTGSMAGTLGKLNPFRYRGYVYDTETGLYYLQSRYYNPETGRFINADNLVDTEDGVGYFPHYHPNRNSHTHIWFFP